MITGWFLVGVWVVYFVCVVVAIWRVTHDMTDPNIDAEHAGYERRAAEARALRLGDGAIAVEHGHVASPSEPTAEGREAQLEARAHAIASSSCGCTKEQIYNCEHTDGVERCTRGVYRAVLELLTDLSKVG